MCWKTLLGEVHKRMYLTNYLWHWAWIFCPKMTQELPKKHHEAGPPQKLPTNVLLQINYGHTRHCQNCKEICLCQQTRQKVFWKIWVGVCGRLSKCSATSESTVHTVYNLQPCAFDLAVAMIYVTVKCYCAWSLPYNSRRAPTWSLFIR